jgi:precorrin-2/cobalt-factor-2 C20-methyltransferase
MTGILRIVGLGPGDPELVTVKAARLIGEAAAVVFFAKRGAAGHARTIAGRYLRPGVEEIRLEYPFTTEIAVEDPAYRQGIDDFHDAVAHRLAHRLAGGCAMVLLCEGDPFFYGSSMHLFDRLAPRFIVEVVPGISAMSGAWSQERLPIAHGDDVLSVLPGTLDDDALRDRLGASEASVVMKVGRNLPRIRAALAAVGKLERALYVERATQPDGTSMRLADRDPSLAAPYFSLVLVPGRERAR